MKKFKSNIYSIIQVLLSNFFTKGVLGILTLMIIRYMDYNEYASYTFIIAVGGLITGVFVASVNTIYIAGYQKLNLPKREACFVPFQCILCLCATILISIFYGLTMRIILVILLFCIGTCLSEFVKTTYQQNLLFSAYNLVEIERVCLYAVFLLIYLYFFDCNIQALCVVLLNAVAFFIVTVFNIISKIQVMHFIVYKDAINIIKKIYCTEYKFLFIYMILGALMGQVNVFVLKEFGTDFALASYGVAYQFYNIYVLILGAINTVFFPGIVKSITKEEIYVYFRLQKKISLIMLPFVLFFDFITIQFIQVYFDGKYNMSIPVFFILSILAMASVVMSPYVLVLFKFGKYKYLSFYTAVVLLLYSISSIILFVEFNIVGLAFSMLVGYSAINIYAYIESKKLIECNYKIS